PAAPRRGTGRAASAPNARTAHVRAWRGRPAGSRASRRATAPSGRPGCRSTSGSGRGVDVRRQRVLGDLDEGVERRDVVHRELGEHAAVDLDPSGLPALDAAVVGQTRRAGRSVEALAAQLAEVAHACLAVAVRVDEGVGDLLLRLAVEARALAAVTGGALEGRTALLLGVDRPLHACHVRLLVLRCWKGSVRRPVRRAPRSLAEQLLDLLDVGRGDRLVHGQTARATAGLVLEVVARVGLLAHDPAATRDPEPLLGTGVRLVLRHDCRLSSCRSTAAGAVTCTEPVRRSGVVWSGQPDAR